MIPLVIKRNHYTYLDDEKLFFFHYNRFNGIGHSIL